MSLTLYLTLLCLKPLARILIPTLLSILFPEFAVDVAAFIAPTPDVAITATPDITNVASTSNITTFITPSPSIEDLSSTNKYYFQERVENSPQTSQELDSPARYFIPYPIQTSFPI